MEFKVVSPNTEVPSSQAEQDTPSKIQALISESPVLLFMKGTPEMPQCGFSARVIQVLGQWKVPFKSFNVLSDESIRQGIKEFSNWPTIPQLYVNNEFVGGCDIIEEISQNGELLDLLKQAYPDQEFTAPKPPAEVKLISPADTVARLKKDPNAHLIDVRGPDEWEFVHIEGAKLLDQRMVEEMVASWDPETPLLFLCHMGQRSFQAAEYFAGQGFQDISSVEGGIDYWAETVDSSLGRY